MQLQIGDRLTDSTGEWEIIGRPYTTNAGKIAGVRVKKVGQPALLRYEPGAKQFERSRPQMLTPEVVGRPYTTAGGKTAHARVQRVGQPLSDDVRTWGAHERIAGVRRA
jgi:hypothetical protein